MTLAIAVVALILSTASLAILATIVAKLLADHDGHIREIYRRLG